MYKSRVGIQSRVISRSAVRFFHSIEMRVKMWEDCVEHDNRKAKLSKCTPHPQGVSSTNPLWMGE
jgi:hypothetical protein